MFIDENVISSSALMRNIIDFVILFSLFFTLIFIYRSSCNAFLKEIFDFLSKLIGNNPVEQLTFLFFKFFFDKFFFSIFSHMIILGNFKLLNFSSKFSFFFHLTKNCIPCGLLSGDQYFLLREIKSLMIQ